MRHSCDRAPRSNPFSTRFVRPGAIPFLFQPGESAQRLVDRLARNHWRGQIVGPHGSGKSTLLATLNAALARAGRRVWSVGLHDGARRMPAGWTQRAARAGANLLVIDGYEQLGRLSRFRVKSVCRRRGWGLLVTAHGDVGFATLVETAPHPQRVRTIVLELLADQADDRLAALNVVAECFAASGGNVRETLFALYDRWEVLHR